MHVEGYEIADSVLYVSVLTVSMAEFDFFLLIPSSREFFETL